MEIRRRHAEGCRPPWERPGMLHPSQTPGSWGGLSGQGCGFWCSDQLSMGRSWGRRNGGIPYSYATASIHLTCRPIATAEGQPSPSVTSWTVKRVALSRRVTTISVMGSLTMQERPSPPRMCARTPKYSQVALCRGGEAKGKSRHEDTASEGGGGEGVPSDPGPLDPGDRQYSLHVCRKY